MGHNESRVLRSMPLADQGSRQGRCRGLHRAGLQPASGHSVIATMSPPTSKTDSLRRYKPPHPVSPERGYAQTLVTGSGNRMIEPPGWMGISDRRCNSCAPVMRRSRRRCHQRRGKRNGGRRATRCLRPSRSGSAQRGFRRRACGPAASGRSQWCERTGATHPRSRHWYGLRPGA